MPRERRVAPGLLEIAERERRRQVEVRGVGGGMERRSAGVEERRDPEEGEEPGGGFLEERHLTAAVVPGLAGVAAAQRPSTARGHAQDEDSQLAPVVELRLAVARQQRMAVQD